MSTLRPASMPRKMDAAKVFHYLENDTGRMKPPQGNPVAVPVGAFAQFDLNIRGQPKKLFEVREGDKHLLQRLKEANAQIKDWTITWGDVVDVRNFVVQYAKERGLDDGKWSSAIRMKTPIFEHQTGSSKPKTARHAIAMMVRAPLARPRSRARSCPTLCAAPPRRYSRMRPIPRS